MEAPKGDFGLFVILLAAVTAKLLLLLSPLFHFNDWNDYDRKKKHNVFLFMSREEEKNNQNWNQNQNNNNKRNSSNLHAFFCLLFLSKFSLCVCVCVCVCRSFSKGQQQQQLSTHTRLERCRRLRLIDLVGELACFFFEATKSTRVSSSASNTAHWIFIDDDDEEKIDHSILVLWCHFTELTNERRKETTSGYNLRVAKRECGLLFHLVGSTSQSAWFTLTKVATTTTATFCFPSSSQLAKLMNKGKKKEETFCFFLKRSTQTQPAAAAAAGKIE